MNEWTVTMAGKDLHSLHLHLREVHMARGGSHRSSSWHWLQGLPSRVYPSSHSKVTLSPEWYTFLIFSSFWIPFIICGRLQFTSEIRKIKKEIDTLLLIVSWNFAFSKDESCLPSKIIDTSPTTSYYLKFSDFPFYVKQGNINVLLIIILNYHTLNYC